MKKLFWSTFAMSLILSSWMLRADTVDEFLNLEEEVIPIFEGTQKFTSPKLHQNAEWRVLKKDVVLDKEPLKGQKHSMIQWSTLDPEEWLDISRWLVESEIKDKNPDWRLRQRDENHLEPVGKVLSCSGECTIFRGTMGVRGQHLSQLVEGDEFRTGKDTLAWIFLMDGTLIKVSPETSLAIQEVNLGQKEVFFLVRLNQGHIFWHPRNQEIHALELAPETDTMTLPLMIKEANQEFFERIVFQTEPSTHLSEFLDVEEKAIVLQMEELNRLKEIHNNLLKIPTKVMMVSPNATLVSSLNSFDMVYIQGGKSYFKKRDASTLGEEFALQLRGYTSTEAYPLQELDWYSVESNGRSFERLESPPKELQLIELLTKRIKTIELAREIWISHFTLPVIACLVDAKELAINHGFTLWDKDLSRRQEFLSEYTRRIETTNLRSLENLLLKYEKNEIPVIRELTQSFYVTPLKDYLISLKERYSNKEIKVREMNDLQYYIWILEHAKLKN